MNKKQRRTLQRIFEKPDRSDIPWNDIESLFLALSAQVSEGRGSRVRVHSMMFVLYSTVLTPSE